MARPAIAGDPGASRLDGRFVGMLLLCTALAFFLWETPLLLPFRLFVTMVHEVSHALVGVATGGVSSDAPEHPASSPAEIREFTRKEVRVRMVETLVKRWTTDRTVVVRGWAIWYNFDSNHYGRSAGNG